MRKTKCQVPKCPEKGTRPICDHHIEKLSPELKAALMKAFRRMKAGRDGAVLVYANTVKSCVLHIVRKGAAEPPKPEQAALL
jgi:hypothetical protein